MTIKLEDSRFKTLLDIRARHPERIAELAAARQRRRRASESGNLFIVAMDHPARAIVKAGDAAWAMANRRTVLERCLTALEQPGVDGILASADVFEDLLILDALHDKLVFGTMNRGGLAGSVWELDDGFTAYSPEGLVASNLDGGKMLLRLDMNDPGTRRTIESCSAAVSALNRQKMMVMVEPLPVCRDGAAVKVLKNADSLIVAIGVASALGGSSAYTWLKVPVVDDMERVMDATTLPTLLLGGDPGADAPKVFAAWRKALCIPQVRGLVAGRALLFPSDGDVVRAVGEAAEIVHSHPPASEASGGSTMIT